jgi:aconitate hydratase
VAYRDHIVGQILYEHLIEGGLIPGTEIGIRTDQTLTQDATGTLVYLKFMSLGVERIQTKCPVSYIDHNTLQTGFENADDHLFLQSAATRYGEHLTPCPANSGHARGQVL